MVTRTSWRVSFGFQSRFRVSTQTSPVRSSTLGWKILVAKFAFGGSCGYVVGIRREMVKTPDSNGVSVGPTRYMDSPVRSSAESSAKK